MTCNVFIVERAGRQECDIGKYVNTGQRGSKGISSVPEPALSPLLCAAKLFRRHTTGQFAFGESERFYHGQVLLGTDKTLEHRVEGVAEVGILVPKREAAVTDRIRRRRKRGRTFDA